MSRPDSPVQARWSVRRRTDFALAVVAVLVVLVVVVAVLLPVPSPLGSPPPVLYLGTPTISGNQTSGWTFLLPVQLAAWVGVGQMPWLNVTFGLVNETNGGPVTPYPIPAGTTLRVFAPSGSVSPSHGPPLAEYNLSAVLWQNGGSAAIQDGQWLVLHGMIPPGPYDVSGTYSTFSGPSLVFTAIHGKATWTMYVPLAGE